MKTCYIAGPYAGTANDDCIVMLARLALAMGMAPVVIHPAIRAGAYGDDNDPEARARGLDAAKAIAEGCDEAWCLHHDDGTMSDGCRYELLHRRHRGGTWADWQGVARVLHPELLPQVCEAAPERKVAPPWVDRADAASRGLAASVTQSGSSWAWSAGAGYSGFASSMENAKATADAMLTRDGWELEAEPARKVAPPWAWNADLSLWERDDLARANTVMWDVWASDNRKSGGVGAIADADAGRMMAAADAALRKAGWVLPEDEPVGDPEPDGVARLVAAWRRQVRARLTYRSTSSRR